MIARIQHYLHLAAASQYEVIAVPPFTVYFSPSAVPFFNYAIPNTSAGHEIAAALVTFRRLCAERERLPRFEFVAEFAPDLPAALAGHGFVAESRNPLMLCSADSLRPAPPVAGLVVGEVTAASPDVLLRLQLETGARGFGPAAPPVTGRDIAGLRADMASGARPFLAWLDDVPVAAGTLVCPADRLVELAGITTLPCFRRRGIAAVLTTAMARAAFDAGAEYALLSAADERACRLYERAGFRPVATLCTFAGQFPCTTRLLAV